jgi:hypothetical protein
MPKTADDLIAPDYVERLMGVLLDYPACVMCHAGGLVFTGPGEVRAVYPPEHRLLAIGDDLVERARHVMAHYTTAPSFWGIYRRTAVDRLLRIPYRAGWDHALLAELALYGEIRHVPELLYWRRNGGGPVRKLARECTSFAQRGLPVDDALADIGWRTPCITTAFNHLEVFALARVELALRRRLMALAVAVFRARWLPLMLHEAAEFRAALPALMGGTGQQDRVTAVWAAQQLGAALTAIETMLPEEDFTLERVEIATLAAERREVGQATMGEPVFAGAPVWIYPCRPTRWSEASSPKLPSAGDRSPTAAASESSWRPRRRCCETRSRRCRGSGRAAASGWVAPSRRPRVRPWPRPSPAGGLRRLVLRVRRRRRSSSHLALPELMEWVLTTERHPGAAPGSMPPGT